GKHVDEPGRHGEPLRIDDCFRLCVFEIADACDPVAANRNIDMSRFSARSIVNRAALDNHVEVRRLLPEHQKNYQENTKAKKNSPHRVVQNDRLASGVKKRAAISDSVKQIQ